MLSARSTLGVGGIANRLASSLAFQHSHSCSLPQQRCGNSLQRRYIAQQSELQQPKTYPSGSIPNPSDPLNSFKTCRAVRPLCQVQTATAIWNSFVKLHPDAIQKCVFREASQSHPYQNVAKSLPLLDPSPLCSHPLGKPNWRTQHEEDGQSFVSSATIVPMMEPCTVR